PRDPPRTGRTRPVLLVPTRSGMSCRCPAGAGERGRPMRLSPDDWADASCRQYDPELWFSNSHTDMQDAIKICHACPLIDACREVSREERFGIWAGIDRAVT